MALEREVLPRQEPRETDPPVTHLVSTAQVSRQQGGQGSLHRPSVVACYAWAEADQSSPRAGRCRRGRARGLETRFQLKPKGATRRSARRESVASAQGLNRFSVPSNLRQRTALQPQPRCRTKDREVGPNYPRGVPGAGADAKCRSRRSGPRAAKRRRCRRRPLPATAASTVP